MGRSTRKLHQTADVGQSRQRWAGFWQVLAGTVAVATGLAVWSPAAASAAATSPEFFGTNFSTLSAIPVDKQPVMLEQLRQSRMTINRIDARWDDIEPYPSAAGKAPNYTFSPDGKGHGNMDGLIGAMASRGLRASPSFRFEPEWIRVKGQSNFPADRYDDFGRMIAAFAKRYGRGGTFWVGKPYPAQEVVTYELWNEVNLGEYAWDGKADAARYGEMVKVVSPIVKAAVPSAIVLGSLSWKDTLDEAAGENIDPDFIAKLSANGGLAALDGMGSHPYAPDAQSTLDLVVRLRRQLTAAGRPDMPIYADEAGQEAVTFDPTTGTTSPSDRAPADAAYKLFPSDAARGANLAFSGEALAASDCGVAQFLPYGASGTFEPLYEKDRNIGLPRTEAWMGLYFNSSGLPTLSAQALQRASLRWASRFDPGGPGAPASLALCSGGPSPEASKLTIDGTFTGLEAGCAKVVTSYDGNPLESAYLRFYDPATGAQLAEARTNAFGQAQQCVPDEFRGKPFRLVANIGQAGTTGVVECDVVGVGCLPGIELKPGRATISARSLAPAGLLPPVVSAPKCTWALKIVAGKFTKDRRGARGRQRLTASVTCNTAPESARLRFVVLKKAPKGNREKQVKTLWLTVGKPRVVGVPDVRRGERIVMLHRGEPTIKAPRLRKTLLAGTKPR